MSAHRTIEAPIRAGSPEAEEAINKYIARCMLLLEHAFGQNYEVRTAFARWAQEKFKKSEDPIFLLHGDPLYFAARYLGIIRPEEIDKSILTKATNLAREKNW